MFKLKPIEKIIRYFLPTSSINRINFCIANIKLHSHLSPIPHFGQSNILKSVLYVEKSAVGSQIILSRIVRNRKKILVTVIPSIRPGQIMKKPCNSRSQIMKVLEMMISVQLSTLEICQLIRKMTIHWNLSHLTLSQNNFKSFLAS